MNTKSKPGTYSLDIVGESHYQSSLEKICGGKTKQGHKKIVQATLIHEDDNPYDDKAIRVDIEGMTVGYLSKTNARKYRKKLENVGHPWITVSCPAMIVGGWDRGGGNKGFFGVKLDLSKSKEKNDLPESEKHFKRENEEINILPKGCVGCLFAIFIGLGLLIVIVSCIASC